MSNLNGPSSTAASTERRARSLPFDVGKFVGRYLQVLACFSIASMAASVLFFQTLVIDVSFIFFLWAGAYLMKHHPTARKWVIGVSALCVILSVAVIFDALVLGTDSVLVIIGRAVDDPALLHVVGIAACFILIASTPLILLLTRQAKNEFSRHGMETGVNESNGSDGSKEQITGAGFNE